MAPTTTDDPDRREVLGWLAGAEARAFARRLLRRDNIGIQPDEVINRAILTVMGLDNEPDVESVDSYGRSRLTFAYRNLLRLELRHQKGVAAPSRHTEEDDDRAEIPDTAATDVSDIVIASAVLDRIRKYLHVSLAASHGAPGSDRHRSVSAAALNVVNISSNGGALPAGMPTKSTKVEPGELEMMAAVWLANPSLRGGEGPDDASLRQARRRFLTPVREELEKAASYAGLARSVDVD